MGLALTDEAGLIPRPHRIVDRETEELSEVLENLVEEMGVRKIIVGYPTPLRTDENERTRQVDEFVNEYIRSLPVPFSLFSERYTTREASRLRRQRGEAGTAGDDEAAALILRHYLADAGRGREEGLDE